MDLSKLYRVPVTIDKVALDCYIDADENCEAVMVGDVNIGPLLDTATSGTRGFWHYLDAVIARELHRQKAEAQADQAAFVLDRFL
jgi:hypothetical protein